MVNHFYKIFTINKIDLKGKSIVIAMLTTLLSSLHVQSQIRFVENQGQWKSPVEYRAELTHGRFFLEEDGFTYALLDPEKVKEIHHNKPLEGSIQGHAVKVRFKGAKSGVELKGRSPYPFYYNFFLGNDPSSWASKVKAFDTVFYNNLYQKIDLEVTSRDNTLKYNFLVKPGGDPHKIRINYNGASKLRVLENGDLQIKTTVNDFREIAPYAFQKIDGSYRDVKCRYVLKDSTLTFEFPEGYQDDRPLVIDPTVIFSTYSGSKSNNFGYSATYDTAGHAYSAGTVFGPNFPVRGGPFQMNWAGGDTTNFGSSGSARDVGIIKYNDSGTQPIYVTYLGGSHNEDPHSMVVNSEQDLLVFGNTGSKDFPMAGNPYQDSLKGNYDIYLARISEDGTQLKSSTFIGGSAMDGLNGRQIIDSNLSVLGWNYGDMFRGEVIVDSLDRVIVATTTKSGDFPTKGAFQANYGGGDQDGCVFKLSKDLSQLSYSSFFGGQEDDAAYSVTVAQDNDILVSGGTESIAFPFSFSGYQKVNQGGLAEGFVFRIPPDFSSISASTFIGTNKYEQAYFVRTGPRGHVYITGQTNSNAFPTKNAAYSIPKGKQFISKFDAQLNNLLLSSTFGSGARKAPDLSPSAFLVDKCGRIYFSGWGGSANFNGNTWGLDVTSNAFDTTTDGSDFYIAVFAQDMEALLYGTYYGGEISAEHVDGGTSRFDKDGIIYQSICAGCGGNSDLPTTPNAWSRVNRGTTPAGGGGCNNALIKINLDVEDVYAGFEAPKQKCFSEEVHFKDKSRFADSFVWSFGDGDTSYAKEPVHKYSSPGKYQITQKAINPFSCKYAAYAYDSITIYDQTIPFITHDTGECVNVRRFSYTGQYGNDFNWYFGDSTVRDTGRNPAHVFKDTGDYIVTLVVDSGTACIDTVIDTVTIKSVPRPDFSFNIDTCQGKVSFYNKSNFADTFLWEFGDGEDSLQNQQAHVTHIYSRSDTFTPRLTMSPGKSCETSTSDTFVLKTTRGEFDYSITDSCQFEVTFFDRSSFTDSIEWDISDGTTIKQKDTFTHIFPGPGQYRIEMRVKGFNGICQDTISKWIKLDSLPYARFGVNHVACESFIDINRNQQSGEDFRWRVFDSSGNYDSAYRDLSHGKVFIPQPQKTYYIEAVSGPFSDCPDTFQQKVKIDSAAHADFTYSLDTCERKVAFNNLSTKNVKYRWDFGDVRGSRKFEPVHTYPFSTGFDVWLYVRDGQCRDSVNKVVGIPLLAIADFTFNRDHCSREVKFKDKSNYTSEILWDFGQGFQTSVEDTTITFKDTGSYKIGLMAKRGNGCPDTLFDTVRINVFADADFSLQKDTCTGKIKLSGATDSMGTYRWDFGNGDTSHKRSLDYTYEDPGNYSIQLIHHFRHCQDTAERSFSISIPKAGYVIERERCSPVVEFKNTSQSVINQMWYFGDGDSSTLSDPVKQYQDTGNFPVKLVINQGSTCTDTFKTNIKIDNFVLADFQVSESPCKSEVFVTESSVKADSVHWHGQGVNGPEYNKSDSFKLDFESGGNYSIKLIAFNRYCTDTLIKEARVNEDARAGFQIRQNPCFSKTNFIDSSTGANSYLWRFGDGNQSNSKNPVHYYSNEGSYEVIYIINHGGQCPDTARKSVTIENVSSSGRELEIPNVITPNGDGINDKFKIKGLTGCEEFVLSIYNRWGQLVFQKEGSEDMVWEGNDWKSGKPLTNGTYYYSLQGPDYSQEGTITLIRNDF